MIWNSLLKKIYKVKKTKIQKIEIEKVQIIFDEQNIMQFL